MDNNLTITELDQRATQSFFEAFDRNQRSLFDAALSSDKAKLQAIESAATFQLNKANTESLIFERQQQAKRDAFRIEANQMNAEVINERENLRLEQMMRKNEADNIRLNARLKHDIDSSKKAHERELARIKKSEDERAKIQELKLRSEELSLQRQKMLLDKASSDSAKLKAKDFLAQTMGDEIEKVNDIFFDTKNVEILQGFEEIMAQAQKDILTDKDPSEVESTARKRVDDLLNSSDTTTKQPFSRAAQRRLAALDKDAAKAYSLTEDPSLLDARLSAEASLFNPRATTSQLSQYMRINPGRAPELQNFKRYQSILNERANTLEDKINMNQKYLEAFSKKLNPGEVNEQFNKAREKQAEDMMELKRHREAIVSGISTAVQLGQSFDEYRKEFESVTPKPQGAKRKPISKESEQLIKKSLTEGSADDVIQTEEENKTNRFAVKASEKLNSISVRGDDGKRITLSALINPLEFGLEELSLKGGFFDRLTTDNENARDRKIIARIKSKTKDLTDKQVTGIFADNGMQLKSIAEGLGGTTTKVGDVDLPFEDIFNEKGFVNKVKPQIVSGRTGHYVKRPPKLEINSLRQILDGILFHSLREIK